MTKPPHLHLLSTLIIPTPLFFSNSSLLSIRKGENSNSLLLLHRHSCVVTAAGKQQMQQT